MRSSWKDGEICPSPWNTLPVSLHFLLCFSTSPFLVCACVCVQECSHGFKGILHSPFKAPTYSFHFLSTWQTPTYSCLQIVPPKHCPNSIWLLGFIMNASVVAKDIFFGATVIQWHYKYNVLLYDVDSLARRILIKPKHHTLSSFNFYFSFGFEAKPDYT